MGRDLDILIMAPGKWGKRCSSWSAFTLSQARKSLAIAVVGGKIVVAGGQPINTQIPSALSKKVDIIDIATNTSTPAADLSTPNSEMKSAVLGNQVIFAGGVTKKAETLDMTTGLWTTYTLYGKSSMRQFCHLNIRQRCFFQACSYVLLSRANHIGFHLGQLVC